MKQKINMLANTRHKAIAQSRSDMTTNTPGAAASYLEKLLADDLLKGADIANVTDVSPATVSRWRKGAMKPQPQNELILSDLYYVVQRLQEYYSTEEIRTWLYSRHPQLNGERAIDLIHGARTIEVLKILDRLDAEAFL
jgi:uncharacterized protein (DUF2384 family)